jgi:hypothetical protein
MSVDGHYLAKRFRLTAIPYIHAYGEWVLCEMLPRFEDIERRGDDVANAEFDRLGAEPAGENCDGDMGWAADKAQDKGLAFYETMQALRQTTLNLFAAGLFHLLEQQLADLCHDGPLLARSEIQPPNDTKMELLATWYRRHFSLDLHSLTTWPGVDEMRLVANSIKHGEGGSAEQLRKRRPQLFHDPLLGDLKCKDGSEKRLVRSPLAGEDLYITEEVFKEYSESANRFVNEIAVHFEMHGDVNYPRSG